MKCLVIGYGAAGKRHVKILEKFKVKKIYVLTKQQIPGHNIIRNFSEVKNLNPDFIIIASITSLHLKYFYLIEKFFRNKKILIEKPVFHKFVKIKKTKNKFYVGYNLRFNPGLIYLKSQIKNKKIIFVNINCSSYLPDWRKNIDNKISMSTNSKSGGGVLLELSHEIDYLKWIFGDFKILSSFNKKVSKLKTRVDDILILNALTKKKVVINMTINFFSKIKKREILVHGNDISMSFDILKNNLNIYKKKQIYQKKWSNFSMEKTYFDQFKSIFSKKNTNLCSLKEGIEIMKKISMIKELN